MNCNLWRFLAYLRLKLPQYQRTTSQLDIPKAQLLNETRCWLMLYGQFIGIETLKYDSDSKKIDVSDQYQEVIMCSLGFLLSGAINIPQTAPQGASKVPESTIEANRLAGVRNSLGLPMEPGASAQQSMPSSVAAQPSVNAQPVVPWNALKMGSKVVNSLNFV